MAQPKKSEALQKTSENISLPFLSYQKFKWHTLYQRLSTSFFCLQTRQRTNKLKDLGGELQKELIVMEQNAGLATNDALLLDFEISERELKQLMAELKTKKAWLNEERERRKVLDFFKSFKH